MKVWVYRNDPSEIGMIDPVIRRLRVAKMLTLKYSRADTVLIPGDRREAMHFCMKAFEEGKRVFHLGGCDDCEGDEYHYDGSYREFISEMARKSGGFTIALRKNFLTPKWTAGPTMQDDLPSLPCRPTKDPYILLCYNWVPFCDEKPPRPPSRKIKAFCMEPGNDGPEGVLGARLENYGWECLEHMKRKEFLRWLAHAEQVWGNSSCITYEAPVWHMDKDIIHYGKRNLGRGIVRWDSKKDGCPSDNVVKILKRESRKKRS